jgi:hypothetical protein
MMRNFILCAVHQILLGWSNQHERNGSDENLYKVLVNLNAKSHLEYL